MDNKTQIKLAQFINVHLFINCSPCDVMHMTNAIACFYKRTNEMDNKTQIELAKYIVDALYVNDFPNDYEHFFNVIECFYSPYKEVLLKDLK